MHVTEETVGHLTDVVRRLSYLAVALDRHTVREVDGHTRWESDEEYGHRVADRAWNDSITLTQTAAVLTHTFPDCSRHADVLKAVDLAYRSR